MSFLKRLWRGETAWWVSFLVSGLMLFAVGALVVSINALLIQRHVATEAVFNIIWNPLIVTLSLLWFWFVFQNFRRSAKKILPGIALAVVTLNAVFIIYGVYYTYVNAQWIGACGQLYYQEQRDISQSDFVYKCVRESKAANETQQ